jgi:ubiquinone/menaquinone biosynthesis C-methylase UbiE
MSSSDFSKNLEHYESVGLFELGLSEIELKRRQGKFGISSIFYPLIDKYYKSVKDLVKPGMQVLEIGCGTGYHSGVVLSQEASVTGIDISEECLRVCAKKHPNFYSLIKANMEEIPLPDSSFDAIVIFGSLSYGDPKKVKQEVFRLLKSGGHLIVKDTLNHNALFRFNRWIEYKKGSRSRSTLIFMPRLNFINSFRDSFDKSELYFYGSHLWIFYPISKLFGSSFAASSNELIERIFPSRKNAFGFVLTCRGFKGI